MTEHYPNPRVTIAWSGCVLLTICGCVGNRLTTPTEPTMTSWSHEKLAGRRYTTEHFDVISTLADDELESAIPSFLEAAHQRYAATLSSTGKAPAKLTTYIFGTRSEWRRFARARYPARYNLYAAIRTGGFTEGTTSVSFHVRRATTLATLAHEGWHQYLNNLSVSSVPAWINEGLACYHEAMEMTPDGPRFTPERNTFRINSLRAALQEDATMPVVDVIRTDAGRVLSMGNHELTQTYYAQAWALVTFLRHHPDARISDAFDRMLRNIADGSFHTRISAATLALSDASHIGPELAAFHAYFGEPRGDIADAYEAHLLRIVGF